MTVALLLTLLSALIHALWNVLLARAPRGIAFLAVANAAGLVALAPVALTRWWIEAGAWPYLVISAALQIYYFVVLNRAYTRTPAHTVYPLARGLGPVLALGATLLTTVAVPPAAIAAVALISIGVWLTTNGTVNRRVITAALPISVSLAAHPVVASHGLRHADPTTYLWLSSAPFVAVVLLHCLITDRRVAALRAECHPLTVVTGLGITLSGMLATVALSMVEPAQVPAIAAARETGILFVVPLSWLISRSFSRHAATGAILVFAGVAILALTSST